MPDTEYTNVTIRVPEWVFDEIEVLHESGEGMTVEVLDEDALEWFRDMSGVTPDVVLERGNIVTMYRP